MNRPRVLLIEDDLSWGALLVDVLTDRGYTFSWVVRVKLVGENEVNLMDIDGRLSPLCAADFDLALIDGKLRTSDLDGPALTPLVVAAGLPVIAISGASSINEQMLTAGASRATAKHDLFQALFEGDDTALRL